MVFAAPGIRRLRGEGMDPAIFLAAACAESLEVSGSDADGVLIWRPGEAVGRFDAASPRVVAVVGSSLEGLPLPHLASARTARVRSTLREWVSRWPGSKLLAPFLSPDAVGARACTVTLPGSSEWIYTSEAPPPNEGGFADAIRHQVVTVFGSGLFPLMPATLASALLLLPALLFRAFFGGTAFVVSSLVVALATTWASVALERWASRRFMAEDPREFVLDEVAGMALAWALVPVSAGWSMVLVAFFLFRLFDIFKWGVSWIEHLPLRGKIVWDDLLAGLYAGLVTLALEAFFRR